MLTNRYLSTRIIPLIAVAAVALCVALIIIVVSVMTGFLDMVKNAGATLTGDVIVETGTQGLPHYQQLIERIEALPESEAATPVVQTFGLVRLPYLNLTKPVQIWGIEPQSFARVTEYGDILYWRPPTAEQLETMRKDDLRRRQFEAWPGVLENMLNAGRALQDPETGEPAAVPGIHVSPRNERTRDGTYEPNMNSWMVREEVVLSTMPLSASTTDMKSIIFPVANEFLSGLFKIDESRVMIPLSDAQDMTNLNAGSLYERGGEIDPETGLPRKLGDKPAEVTKVLVKAAPGVTPKVLSGRIENLYEEFYLEFSEDEDILLTPTVPELVNVRTWEEQISDFIGPIEKERELMRVLFMIIYIVCAGLVLAIFWAIVYEKTRDIGILRSIGASRFGILWIFLRYGLVIGIVGAVFGLGIGALVVHYINSIHDAMGYPAPTWLWRGMYALAGVALLMTLWMVTRGDMLPILLWSILTLVLIGLGVALMLHKGTLIWDPSVYYFNEIPNELDITTVIITMTGAVVFSVIGASIPAAKAADTDPVRALRYE